MDFNKWRESHNKSAGAISQNDNTCNMTSNSAINEKIEQYAHLSNAEMMQALFRAVNDEKSKGIFDINNIWSFYRNISPMLDAESRGRLRDIIESIDINKH